MQWNNPDYWINYPKDAAPIWTNLGFGPKSFEHQIISDDHAIIKTGKIQGIDTITYSFKFNIQSDTMPNDFMVVYEISYGGIQPVVSLNLQRPDNHTFNMLFSSLPPQGNATSLYVGRIFSSDKTLRNNILQYRDQFKYDINNEQTQDIVFSSALDNRILKGTYNLSVTFFVFDNSTKIQNVYLILGGDVFGLLGTDDLRRDLAIGIIWGSPVALFIGLTVSTISISIGTIYGVIAGYRGKKTDEVLMRINDIFYSLPSLPLLIILSITIGRSIFSIAGILVIFGWVGTAKIIRSIALQIRNFQYVDASKLMGQSDIKIIFKHIIPLLLPLTFASIAISVPGAILAEAGLSFLGLGDPSLPTWGQMLHDANSSDAASRGLWWWIIPPGLMIALTGLAFFLVGNALDKLTNKMIKR